MSLPFGFFSGGYGRPMAEPAPVRTNPDAPNAGAAQEQTVPVEIRTPRPSIPWQRYPQAGRTSVPTRDVTVATDPAPTRTRPSPQAASPAGLPPGIAMPARPMYLPFRPRRPGAASPPPASEAPGRGAGGRMPGGGRTPGFPGGGGGGGGGGAPVDAGGGGGGGGGSTSAGGGGAPADSGASGVTDADLIAFLNAAAAGQLPDDMKALLPDALAEAQKRGLPIPAALLGGVGTSKSDVQPAAAGGAGVGLAVAGAGAGFLVAGPIGAAVGAAAGLLLGRK